MLLLEESGLKALNNVIVLIIWNKLQLTTQTNNVVNSWLTTDINYLNNKFKLESKKPIVMSLDEGPTMALKQCSKINIYLSLLCHFMWSPSKPPTLVGKVARSFHY